MGGTERLLPADRFAAPRVCAFGQLRLRFDDREVPIHGKPARVLGGLLVDRGGVTLEGLVEVVWPVSVPKSARASLHVHLGTVRRLLRDAPTGASVERTGSRYCLHLDGWEVDLDLFEAITKAGYAAAKSDPLTASGLFGESLAISQGPVLVVDGEPIARSLDARFELARLDVEEAQVEAMLAVGELAVAESLVVEMIEASPYRERRWEQLMRLQVASGRTADALRTASRARRRLVEDLGVEPGAALKSMEASILARESHWRLEELDPPPRAPVALIGRARLIERTETALGRSSSVVLLGAPGVGKTRLAVELADRAVNVGRPVSWVDLRTTSLGDRDLAERIVTWTLSSPGGLVVFDNADFAKEALEVLLGRISRVTSDVHVVITSRVPVGSASTVVTLPSLDVPSADGTGDVEACESVRLLRTFLGVLAPNTAVTTEMAAELCRRVGGLPLGIELIAELARVMPPTEVGRIVGSRLEPAIKDSVTGLLECLDEAERTALKRLSVVAGNLDSGLMRALLGWTDERLIGRLIEYGLVQFDPSRTYGPYSICEPFRNVFSELISDGERRAALDRLADHCVARSELGALPPATDEEGRTLRASLAHELPWHRQAIGYLAERGDDRRALSIVSNLELSLYAVGWWATNVELQDAALAIAGPPSSLRANVHAARGRPGLLHRIDVDHLTTAIEMAERLGDTATTAKATFQLGIRRWWERRWEEALELLDRAQRTAAECGDPFVEVESLRFSGIALVSSGEVESGLDIQIGVLRRVERSRRSVLHVPHVRMYLGHCRRHIGDGDAALVDLEFAREGFVGVGNRASLIHVCAGLAELYADRGHSELALARAREALRTAADGMITTYDPWVLCSITRVHTADGDVDGALLAIDRAVASLSRNWVGEIHRVAVELAAVATLLGAPEAAARLIGVAEASEDRRELPFQSPAERSRLVTATEAAARELGDGYDRNRRRGETSTIAEALGPLLASR